MKNPTEYDLRQSIEHIAFEFYHFELYGSLIQSRMNGRSTILDGLYQAVEYEFLIHLRALLDFFFMPHGQDDDLLARDFCILPSFKLAFKNESPASPEWVRTLKKHLNKHLAHITSPRWAEPAPAMNYYYQYFLEIRELISSFKAALSADLRSPLEAYSQNWLRRDLELRRDNPG